MISNFLPGSRIYDLTLLTNKSFDSVDGKRLVCIHTSHGGPLQFAQICLKTKTAHACFEHKEVSRLAQVSTFPWLCLAVERFVGPRLISADTEQIAQRLKSSNPQEDLHC